MSNDDDSYEADTDTGLTIPTPPPTEAPPAAEDSWNLRPLATWIAGGGRLQTRHVEIIFAREGAQFCVSCFDGRCDATGEGWGTTIAEAAADAMNDIMRRAAR